MPVRHLSLVPALLVTAVVIGWVAGLVIAPGLGAQPGHPATTVFAVTVYTAGALVCHQAPERSFHLNGVRLPVCARCAGLYAGAAFGMLLWWGVRTRPATRRLADAALPMLALVAVPTAVTWASAMLGLWDPGNLTRAVAALPLGAAVGAVVTATVSGELR